MDDGPELVLTDPPARGSEPRQDDETGPADPITSSPAPPHAEGSADVDVARRGAQLSPEGGVVRPLARGGGILEIEAPELDARDAQRWPSSCALLLGATPVSLCALLLSIVLVCAGKTVQELNRPAESATLWEVSTCCTSPSATCATFVGTADGACPPPAAAAAAQAWLIRFDRSAILPDRSYRLALYVSAGAEVELRWSLVDSRGVTLVPEARVLATVGASRRARRRLAARAATADVRRALQAGGAADDGAEGGDGASDDDSEERSRRSYYYSGYSDSDTRARRRAGGRGGPRTAGRGASSVLTAPAARAYRSAAQPTAYGSRRARAVGAGALLGIVVGSGRDTPAEGGGELRTAEEALDRLEITSPTFTAPAALGGSWPLTLRARAVRARAPRPRVGAPVLLLALYTAVTDSQLQMADGGSGVWLLGAAMALALFLLSVGRFSRWRPGGDKSAAACILLILQVSLSGVAAGCVAIASPFAVTHVAGWALLLAGLTGVAGAVLTGRRWRVHAQREGSTPVPARVEQPGGSVDVAWVEPDQADGGAAARKRGAMRGLALAHAAALLGLALACACAVRVEEGRFLFYAGVGAGVALACAGWGGAWAAVKDEHVITTPAA